MPLPQVQKDKRFSTTYSAQLLNVLFCIFLLGFLLNYVIEGIYFLVNGNYYSAFFDLVSLLASLWLGTDISICIYANLKDFECRKARDYLAAEALWTKALFIRRKLPVAKLTPDALFHMNIGWYRFLQGKFDSAETSMRESLALLETKGFTSKWYFPALALDNLAQLCLGTGRLDEAEEFAKKALTFYESDKAFADTVAPSCSLLTLGQVCRKRQSFDFAQDTLLKAEKLLLSAKLTQTTMPEIRQESLLVCRLNLAIVQYGLERSSEAKLLCQQILEEIDRNPQTVNMYTIPVLQDLSTELLNRKEYKIAEQFLEYAYQAGRLYPTHPDSIAMLDVYGSLLQQTDRHAEIADMRNWVRPVQSTLLAKLE